MLAAAALATLLAACGGSSGDGAGTPESPPQPSVTASASPSPAAAGCTEVEMPQLQGSNHLLEGEPPVPYSSIPPTSGWHSSGAPRTGVIGPDEPLTDPEIVNVLEGGDVVITYDPQRVDDAAVARLAELVRGSGELTVTPYEADTPTAVTYLAWGVLQRCDGVEPAALEAFVAAHAGQLAGEEAGGEA